MLQPRLVSVKPEKDMHLQLIYETGEHKLFDVSSYATGSWYGMLQSPDYFQRVRLIENGYGIEWPEGQDIAPHELYECSVSLPPM